MFHLRFEQMELETFNSIPIGSNNLEVSDRILQWSFESSGYVTSFSIVCSTIFGIEERLILNVRILNTSSIEARLLIQSSKPMKLINLSNLGKNRLIENLGGSAVLCSQSTIDDRSPAGSLTEMRRFKLKFHCTIPPGFEPNVGDYIDKVFGIVNLFANQAFLGVFFN